MHRNGYPYEVASNSGRGWGTTCTSCYYADNNRFLHEAIRDPGARAGDTAGLVDSSFV